MICVPQPGVPCRDTLCGMQDAAPFVPWPSAGVGGGGGVCAEYWWGMETPHWPLLPDDGEDRDG